MKIFSKTDDDKGLSLFTFSHCGSVLALLGPCGWTLPARLLCPWDSPGQNTGVGCHALLQGIFPTQGSTRVSCSSCPGKRVLYRKVIWGACRDQAVQSVIGLGQWRSLASVLEPGGLVVNYRPGNYFCLLGSPEVPGDGMVITEIGPRWSVCIWAAGTLHQGGTLPVTCVMPLSPLPHGMTA